MHASAQPPKSTPYSFSALLTALALIAAVTFLSFSPCMKAGFIEAYDDGAYVSLNPDITPPFAEMIKKVFTSTYVSEYVPLAMVSYTLDYRFSGLDPKAYHRTNLILHVINCLLVFWLVLLLSGGDLFVPFLTALFFGIHPLHVESVAWVAERKDVLYTLFFLASLISYTGFRKNGRTALYGASVFLFVLSLLSKPMAMTLPFVLLLIDYFREGRFTAGQLKNKAIFFVLAAAAAVLTVATHAATDVLDTKGSYLVNLLVASRGIVFYLWKLIVPAGLSFIYPFPKTVLTLPYIIAPILLLGLAALVYRKARHDRTMVFGSLFFVVTLLPVLQLVTNGQIAAADRYAYVPSIGIFFAAFTALSRSFGPLPAKPSDFISVRPLLSLFLILLTAVFSLLAWNRCRVWRTPLSLWQDTAGKYPGAVACNHLGVTLHGHKEYAQAVAWYDKALASAPEREIAIIYNNRGLAYFALHDYKKAEADLTTALERNYFDAASAYYHRALAYDNLGLYEKAFADYARAYELLPGALRKQARGAAQDAGFIKDIKLSVSLKDVYNNRGMAYAAEGKTGKAEVFFRQALKIDPSYAHPYYNLGNLYSDQRKNAQAIECYSRAIALDPGNYKAYTNRAVTYYFMKDYVRAWKDAMEAQRLGHPANSDFLQELSALYRKEIK